MKSRKWAGVAILIVLAIMITVPVMAAESLIDLEVSDKVVAMDKNGNEYVRLIVGETRKIQGVEYQIGTAAMAFGQNVEAAKSVNIGDNLKAIVNSRTYNGRESYTILKIL